MLPLNLWDVAVIAVAAFIAVAALLRLMQWRRDRVLKALQEEFDKEQQRNHRARREKKKNEAA